MSGLILVVDDVPANVKLLDVKLTAEYYTVVTAKGGQEALIIAETQPIDLILLDVMMPGMDGFEVCRLLKANPKTTHIPVIMVTALTSIADRVAGLQAGADDFLSKPIQDLALFTRIRHLLRLKTMTDQLRLRNQSEEALGGLSSEFMKDIRQPKGAMVVVVDDRENRIRRIGYALMKEGYRIALITKPPLIMDFLEKNPVDLMVLSLALDEIDGLRLCSQIRGQGLRLPVVVIPPEDETAIIYKAFELGVNDYVSAPLDMNELMARVQGALKRSFYHDALRASYEKNLSLAITDGLMNVYNRRYFDVHYPAMLAEAIQKKRPMVLMLLDVDHFKLINDHYGHPVGDTVLRGVAEACLKALRVSDVVARYGGEEVAILLPSTKLALAYRVGERLRESISQLSLLPKLEADHGEAEGSTAPMRVTVSIGVAESQEGDLPESMLQAADQALYDAKHQGRNRLVIAGRHGVLSPAELTAGLS
jgi:two-component system cell cycle response regulator